MLNKQQQVIEFLSAGEGKTRPSEYHFWFRKEEITISNWASLLRDSQTDEIIDIWMKREVPKLTVELAEEYNSRIPTRRSTFDAAEIDGPDTRKTIPIVSAFLAWDILDEIGEPVEMSLSNRVNRFLKAIYARVKTETNLQVTGAVQRQVGEYVSKQNDDYISLLWKDFQEIFRCYVPEEQDFAPLPIEMYWGGVYEILQV